MASSANSKSVKGSLLSPEAMGGLWGGGGYDTERDYILGRLHKWLSDPAFSAIQLEGFTEVELAFTEDAARRLQYIQIKDHLVDLNEGRAILIEFYNRQSSSGPQYEKYILACGGLIGKMASLQEAVNRYRSADLYSRDEKAPTLKDINKLLKASKVGIPAEFLVGKVYFDIDGEWLKSEDLRLGLFKVNFAELPNFRLSRSNFYNRGAAGATICRTQP